MHIGLNVKSTRATNVLFSLCVCVCVFLFSLFNWFASLFLCYRILFSFAMCNVHWNDTGKIKFERKTFGWYDGLDQCAVCTCKTDSHELSKSEKVVSSCFLHCNANTHKYICIFWYAMNIFGWWIRERRWQWALTAMRVHFYVNCILKTMWYTTPACMFLNCSIAPLLQRGDGEREGEQEW